MKGPSADSDREGSAASACAGKIETMEDPEKNEAIEIVLAHMRANAWPHGPVIAATRQGEALWDVEIAHAGNVGRGPTRDPPSLEFVVNCVTKSVRLMDVM